MRRVPHSHPISLPPLYFFSIDLFLLLNNTFHRYDNIISNCGDDGISADGTCSNCRMWNNVISDTLAAISLAPVEIGPIFSFRNLIYNVGHGRSNAGYTGLSFKFNVAANPGGTYYVYHNTIHSSLANGTAPAISILSPGTNPNSNTHPSPSPPPNPNLDPPLTLTLIQSLIQSNLYFLLGDWDAIVSRNNIFDARNNYVLYYSTSNPIDFNYDLLFSESSTGAGWSSQIAAPRTLSNLADMIARTGFEPNGKEGNPRFNPDYTLQATSAAIDMGVLPSIDSMSNLE